MHKRVKMLLIIFLSLVSIFLGVGVYGFLVGALAPPFDSEKMTLNYEKIGSGPNKLLLLHGLTGSLNYWKRDIDRLKDTHTFLLVDLLGFGDSPKPKSKYDLNEHIKALEKVIVKEGFNSGKTVVAGHSLGAIISVGLISKHPKWFKGAAVIGLPVYSGKGELKSKMSQASVWNGIAVDSRYKFICFFHPLYMVSWFRPSRIPEDIFRDAAKHTWVSFYHSLDQVIMNTDLYNLSEEIKDIRILIIHGNEDKTAPIENVEKLAQTIPNSTMVRLEDADHQLFLKDPGKVWDLINDYFYKKQWN